MRSIRDHDTATTQARLEQYFCNVAYLQCWPSDTQLEWEALISAPNELSSLSQSVEFLPSSVASSVLLVLLVFAVFVAVSVIAVTEYDDAPSTAAAAEALVVRIVVIALFLQLIVAVDAGISADVFVGAGVRASICAVVVAVVVCGVAGFRAGIDVRGCVIASVDVGVGVAAVVVKFP